MNYDKKTRIKINLGFFYKFLNKHLLNLNKKGKFFNFKNIIQYFFLIKLKGLNYQFFIIKNLDFNTLYLGYGYTKKKLKYPRTFKIPIKINKRHQLVISLRLFSIYSLYRLNILLMYLNIEKYFLNDLIFDYQEKIEEDKYYII